MLYFAVLGCAAACGVLRFGVSPALFALPHNTFAAITKLVSGTVLGFSIALRQNPLVFFKCK